MQPKEKFDPMVSAEQRFRVYCRVANLTHVSERRLCEILDSIGESEGLTRKRQHEIVQEGRLLAVQG